LKKQWLYLFQTVGVVCLQASSDDFTLSKSKTFQKNIPTEHNPCQILVDVQSFTSKDRLNKSSNSAILQVLYSKLLFWNNNPIKAKQEIEKYKNKDKILYEKIYLAWSVAMLKKKNIQAQHEFIKNLEPFARKSYDVLWIEMQSYIQMKNLEHALEISSTLFTLYPQSQEAGEQYARLLFWNHHYTKSLKVYQDLEIKYHKSYTKEQKQLHESMVVEDRRVENKNNILKKRPLDTTLQTLKEKKSASQKLKYINTLSSKKRASYDVLWIEIQSHLELDHLKIALTLTEDAVKKYPKSRDLNERYAALLFWNNYNYKSLNLYTKMQKMYHADYTKKIHQIKDKLQAKKQKESEKTLQQEIQNIEPWNLKNISKVIDGKNLKSKYMLGFGIERGYYSDHRFDDITKYIEMTFPIDEYVMYLKVHDTNRYGLKDQKLEGELYPKLPNPHWGFLSFSYTPKRDFYSNYSLGWHHYYSTGKWQFGLSYQWSKYGEDDVSLYAGEYVYYLSEFLFIRQTFAYAPGSKSWANLNQIRYQGSKHFDWSLDYTLSNSNEEIAKSNRISNMHSKYLKTSVEFPLKHNYSIGGQIGRDWRTDKHNAYTRDYVNLFIRKYW
jgi:YaiO family outer membrane protein